MREITADDRTFFVVGRPVPVSVYGADRTLLLAAGRPIPNEFVRESLLRAARYVGNEDGSGGRPATEAAIAFDPIAALQADYQHTQARAPVGFRMEREHHALTARVIGVTDDGRGLILTGPVTTEDGAASVTSGDVWTFRALYATAAVRFHATIEKVANDPFPYFYASHITDIDRRSIRQWPRTPTCLWAARSGEPPRVIVDLSVGGARVAADERTHLQQGQILLLNTSLTLAIGRKDITLDATVMNRYGRTDPKHPGVEFYGVRFENVSDQLRLTLHAYVQEHLSLELDRVWHVLSIQH